MIEHDLAFSRIQSPLRRGADPLWNGWLHMAIQRGPRHTESATGDCLTNALAQLQSGAHQLSSSIWMFGIGLPNNAATFFVTSMINSAFFTFFVKRAFAACSSRFSFTSGLTTTLGPRFLAVRASNSPCLRCCLHVARCEE